jgi:hypothetical protein
MPAPPTPTKSILPPQTNAQPTDFKEDPLRRDMRPTFPQLLELSRLAANYDLQRLPSIGRNTQVRACVHARLWVFVGLCVRACVCIVVYV